MSKRVVAVGALAVVIAGGSIAALAFNDSSPASNSLDNASATALATVRRQSLSSRTEVSATLGYAGSGTLVASAGARGIYTRLPKPGQIVRMGEPIYWVNGEPVILLYGPVTPWRPYRSGMSSGADVAALNAALGLGGDEFTSATTARITAFQEEHGLPETGTLEPGAVVFEPGPVRVTTVTPTVGAAVQAGPVLTFTSTKRQVTIQLDAAQQDRVKVGDAVTITLPDQSTTPGKVTFVGSVATTPTASGDSSSSQNPTVEVDVTPTHPATTGRLDQAPVQVSITTANVRNALAVPVNALLALASGGYAVEVSKNGVRKLVPVELGLFDDATGLVQVTSRLRAGEKVVVPAS